MKQIFFSLICIILLTSTVLAASTDLAQTDWLDESELQAQLSEEEQKLLEGITLENADLSSGVGQVLKGGLYASSGYLKSALWQAAQMLAVVVLCSMVSCMENARLPKIIGLAGALAVTAIGFSSISSTAVSGSDTLSELKTYADMLLPAISMATASCGGFTAASTLYVGTIVFVDVLTHLITTLLQPLVYIYMALTCAGAAVGNQALKRLQETVGGIIAGSLKAILFVFTAYLTITGAISGNADSTTVKAAKLTLSGIVPVVGSMISDASETLVVSASILRNSIGVFGLLAVLAICILPFLQAGIRYLVLKITAAIAGIFDTAQISGLISSISTATGYLLAMTGACALMLIISFVCYIKVVIV